MNSYFGEWICEETLNTEQKFGDCKRQWPIVLNYVNANVAMPRYIRMYDFS